MNKDELNVLAELILNDLLSKDNIAIVTKSAPMFVAPLLSMLDPKTITNGMLQLIPLSTINKVESALSAMGYARG